MLDAIAPVLGPEKGRDLQNRLNDPKQVEQALPAEMELALLWAIQSLGDLEIEPEWWGDSRRGDALAAASERRDVVDTSGLRTVRTWSAESGC